MDVPEEAAGILSLHYFVAGEYGPAWRYATMAGRRAHDVFAYVEAAGLYARALEAGRRLAEVSDRELAAVHDALGDSWNRAGDFRKAAEAYSAARRPAAGRCADEAELLLKRSRMEEKLGNIRRRGAGRRGLARPSPDFPARRPRGRPRASNAWYATLLQVEGRTKERSAGPDARLSRPKPSTTRTRSGPRAS